MPLKIINQTPFVKDGKFDFINKYKAESAYGAEWVTEVEAHSGIVARLARNLPDRFTLLQNFIIPDLEYPIPFILIGPTGVRVLYVSPTAGLFEAAGDEWNEFDKRSQLYKPASPNLIRRTVLFSKAVESFARRGGKSAPFLDPVLIFSNAGIDIETKDSLVKVVRLDALPRFIPSLNEGSATMTTANIEDLVKHFIKSLRNVQEREQKKAMQISLNSSFLSKFSRSQLIILAVLAIFLLAVIGTIMMILLLG